MGDRIEYVQPRPFKESAGTALLSLGAFGALAFNIGALDSLPGMLALTALSAVLGGFVWFSLQGERS